MLNVTLSHLSRDYTFFFQPKHATADGVQALAFVFFKNNVAKPLRDLPFSGSSYRLLPIKNAWFVNPPPTIFLKCEDALSLHQRMNALF